MSLFAELKRRNVVRVAIGYLAGAWLLIQILETLLPIFGLPETSARVIVILLAIGFIPALVISWYFEITPEGLVRDSEAPKTEARRARTFDRVVAGVLTIAVVYFAVDKFVLDPARDAELLDAARQAASSRSYGDISIAVLPFVNLSTEADQRIFSDGISEELIVLLASVPELAVTPRSSAFQFRGDVAAREAAEKLGVDYVLEGSVRRSGERVRIIATLIDAQTNTSLWSEPYNRELDDVFALQEEIAAAVVDSLKIQLLDPVSVPDRTSDEVHQLYLQASHIWNNRLKGSYSLAEEMIEKALELDPGYVPAWTLRARIHYVQYYSNQRLNDEDLWALIRSSLDKAEALDPEHPEVLSWQSFILREIRDEADFPLSIEYSRRALARNPSDEIALRSYANFARNIGRRDAAGPIYEYILDRSPLCLACYESTVVHHLGMGNTERVLELTQKARALGLDSDNLRKRAASAYTLLGQPERALEELAGIGDIFPGDVQKQHGRAMAFHSLGRQDEALEQFDLAIDAANECQEAQIAAWMGDIDDAFDRLGRANASRCNLKNDPFYETLRDDPRWPALLEANRIPGVEDLDFSLDFITESGNP